MVGHTINWLSNLETKSDIIIPIWRIIEQNESGVVEQASQRVRGPGQYTYVACYIVSLNTVTALLEYLGLDSSITVSQSFLANIIPLKWGEGGVGGSCHAPPSPPLIK